MAFPFRPVAALVCVFTTLLLTTIQPLAAQRPFTIVSVGDSVASGEGNPDVPQSVELNSGYNPVEFLPNPNFHPLPEIPNPDFNPVPAFINPNFDPRQTLINLDYQPFELPLVLVPLLPNFPPHNPNLTITNPDHDPNLTIPNPLFDPDPLMENPNYDPNLLSSEPNPEYDTNLFNISKPAVWVSEADHRSDLAGPALAAAELISNHPERAITFLHLAKSGANIEGISNQIERAIGSTGGRIDVLMISAGGNNIGGGSFGELFGTILDAVKSGHRPSKDTALSDQLETGWITISNEFAALANRLEDCEIGEVFIAEYFDMTRGSDGQMCFGDTPILGEEMQWAYDRVIVPLNETIEAAAGEHGWHYVGGIADGFRMHGMCADRNVDLRPVVLNPNFDPRGSIPNWNYNPVANLPNFEYNPIQRLPNLSYNPIEQIPNLNYDPRRNIANPGFNINPFSPDYDPRLTIPNPGYDPALLVLNPNYNPNPTIPNPAYDPHLTVPNPNFDNRQLVSNPGYDPKPTIVNHDFNPIPLDGENWVVRPEESFLLQGDHNGTAHPNYRGQEFYARRLIEEMEAFGLDNILRCPEIFDLEFGESGILLRFSNEHPFESLKLQWTRSLNDPFWEDVDESLRQLDDQMFEIDVPRGDNNGFFRVVVE